MPLLPLRGMLVFPGMIINLDVGRERSIHAVEAAMTSDKQILLVSQKEAVTMEPGQKDLFKYGVIAEIKQLLKLPSGALRILVEGLARAKVETIIEAREKLVAVKLQLRLLHDLKQLSLKNYANASLMTESISKQLSAWQKSYEGRYPVT